jgi:hypothetical protein
MVGREVAVVVRFVEVTVVLVSGMGGDDGGVDRLVVPVTVGAEVV